MKRDTERVDRLQHALQEDKIDLLVCTRPMNVLMTSGYWPVVGTSMSLVTKDGRATLIVPEDEKELAEHSWADEIRTFSTGSLKKLNSVVEAIREPLEQSISALRLDHGSVVASEYPAYTEPAPYVATYIHGLAFFELLREAARSCAVVPALDTLQKLRLVLTKDELSRLRISCSVAAEAFEIGRNSLRPGIYETEAAQAFRGPPQRVWHFSRFSAACGRTHFLYVWSKWF